MDFKDYYAILGVSPDTDDKTIKKAYHQLAKKYHPDVNPGDKASEDKFKEVTEAYQAVIDPAKRVKYDELRSNYQQWQARGGRGDFDWERWQARPRNNRNTRTVTPEEFAEMFGNQGGYRSGSSSSQQEFSDFFSSIFGMGGGEPNRFTNRYSSRAQVGQDAEVEVGITLEEAFQGTTRVIQTENKRIEAKIPPGVHTGSKVRLVGQGSGFDGGPKGDLYLLITVQPHALYIREGDDLVVEFPVDIYTAVLGGDIIVHTLAGEVLLKIPPLSQSGQKFRLKGKGMPKLEHVKQHGDLFAKLRIILPEALTQFEIKTFKELAEKRTDKKN
ncbi:MAG: DnaJ C-terminal domain-containing protein [Desulfitobacteriaceae bacterium]